MDDRNKIIAGLAVFVVIITFPFWFNFIKFSKEVAFLDPELSEKAKISGKCVVSNGTMASEHMQILDLWRHSAVRGAERSFINNDGLEYEISLTTTCLGCHTNKKDFCDRCHEYASVKPYCWSCHTDDSKGDER